MASDKLMHAITDGLAEFERDLIGTAAKALCTNTSKASFPPHGPQPFHHLAPLFGSDEGN